jgi:YHS domain-containing protein
MITADQTTVDPVCGMAFAPQDAAMSDERNGHTWYLPSKSRRGKSQADPPRYGDAQTTLLSRILQ